jgi:hypothetical protein
VNKLIVTAHQSMENTQVPLLIICWAVILLSGCDHPKEDVLVGDRNGQDEHWLTAFRTDSAQAEVVFVGRACKVSSERTFHTFRWVIALYEIEQILVRTDRNPNRAPSGLRKGGRYVVMHRVLIDQSLPDIQADQAYIICALDGVCHEHELPKWEFEYEYSDEAFARDIETGAIERYALVGVCSSQVVPLATEARLGRVQEELGKR